MTSSVADRLLIPMPDGRKLEILAAGPREGLPLVVHDGTPVGLGLYPPTVEAARERGLWTVQIARPGYERSTPRPGRRVADIAADVAAVLDHLEQDNFVTAGWSGGGPHALACAALLPGRCLAAASVAGVAPYRAEGLDWTAGMGPENVEEFTAATTGPDALTAFLEREAQALRDVSGEDVARSLGGLVSAVDVAALTGAYADHLAAGLRAAVREGVAGWREDDLAFVADWGFTLDPPGGAGPGGAGPGGAGPGGSGAGEPRQAPVVIWQGDQDRMVPFAHGKWLAGHFAAARTYLMPGEGHLTLTVTSIHRILDDLLDLAGVTP